jgi:exodeoxyribonuclease VII small subunit
LEEAMNGKTEEKPESFENILQKLERNVAELESGEVPLEEALRLFEEGIELSKVLTRRLAEAEESVKRLVKSGEGSFDVEEFRGEEDDG